MLGQTDGRTDTLPSYKPCFLFTLLPPESKRIDEFQKRVLVPVNSIVFVEEFLSRLRLGTFLLDTYSAYRRLSMGGYGENRFLALKVTKRPPIGLKFWPHVEGKRRVDCEFFASGKFP